MFIAVDVGVSVAITVGQLLVVVLVQSVRDLLRRHRQSCLPHTNKVPRLEYHDTSCRSTFVHLNVGSISANRYGLIYKGTEKPSWLKWLMMIWKFRLLGYRYDDSHEDDPPIFLSGYLHPIDPGLYRRAHGGVVSVTGEQLHPPGTIVSPNGECVSVESLPAGIIPDVCSIAWLKDSQKNRETFVTPDRLWKHLASEHRNRAGEQSGTSGPSREAV